MCQAEKETCKSKITVVGNVGVTVGVVSPEENGTKINNV